MQNKSNQYELNLILKDFQKGFVKESVIRIKNYIAKFPNDLIAKYNYAVVLEKINETKEASKLIKQRLKRFPIEMEFKKDFDRWLRPFFSSEDSTVLSKCSSSFHRERSTKSCPSFLITSEMFNPPSFNEFFNDIKVFDVLRAQFIERSGGAVGNMFLSCEYLIFFNIKAQANDFSVWLAGIFESCSKRLSAVSGVPKMG